MRITIGSGDVRIERDLPADPVRVRPPFKVRRRLVLDAVARERRKRLRIIDGGLPDVPRKTNATDDDSAVPGKVRAKWVAPGHSESP